MAREVAEADRGSRAPERHRARGQTLAYLDTSAFVKLLVREEGAADVVAAWLGADRRVSSLLLYPEARAAIGRARRMGRLRSRQVGSARRRIEALWAVIDSIELTEALARRAGDLGDEHGLRAYDAIHLASLEHVGDPETVLVSADGELLHTAHSLGFTTIRPLG